jgi:thymidylate synthase (FAD)
MIAVTYIDRMGTDLSVVNAARVSFGKKSEWVCGCEENADGTPTRIDPLWCPGCNPMLKSEDAKLIKYLATHGHYSPFGHCFASFHIKAPIFVARQLVKHEYLRMNEISRRYVDSEPEFYVPDVWRGRAKDKKQGSDGVVKDIQTDALPQWHDDALHYYSMLLESGVAPEMARMVLPQSMYTEWYWSGSLDAFANMCNLRLKEDTQYETRLVAQQIDEMMQGLYPISWKALVHHG